MKVLWDQGSLAARDVFAALPHENEWAYKTVKTLLARLVAKGALDYEQIGNSYLYHAAVQRETMTRQEVRSLFQRVRGMTLSPVLAKFIEEVPLSEQEIQHLRQLLEEKRKQNSQGHKISKKKGTKRGK
ncbi:Penicillinase repressor [Bythopirellula polymerisocia]|uniref:Penicillinase repressor n=2 Tax=Bythopirellula polymerisocia TaxID=2528003 RepID=A0A5C6D614_9BACT|nr:Penicillinase repressor [Bythopirellula polymerisocia]